MIESLFGYNAAARCSVKLEEGQSRSPSLGHHVLDPKRLQNITILMKAVNATADQIYAALLQGTVTNELQRLCTVRAKQYFADLCLDRLLHGFVGSVQGTACRCSSWRH
jgi:hypothetical protein